MIWVGIEPRGGGQGGRQATAAVPPSGWAPPSRRQERRRHQQVRQPVPATEWPAATGGERGLPRTPGRAPPPPPELVAQAREDLTGYDLACYCAPELPCHVDVLLEILALDPKEPA
ncbi:DUF4326 domain-containing protein [Nocardioides luteus]|uniref:DUF4326 domain-containing protein n=1 Tax=Nocardioides luteus TaxID=1844 RepID=UPI0018CA0EE3